MSKLQHALVPRPPARVDEALPLGSAVLLHHVWEEILSAQVERRRLTLVDNAHRGLKLMFHIDEIQPMLLDDRKYTPFSDPNWLYEIKYDGYRMLAEFGNGNVELRTRQGQDCTPWFPEIVQTLEKYEGGPFIVDGEVTVLDEHGRSDFDRLQDRARRKRYYEGCDPVIYCMFDLLVAAKSLMELPLELRKTLLAQLFTPSPTHSLLVVEAIPENGLGLYQLAVQLKIEGLTAKLADSPYLPGARSDAWRKLKRPGAVPPERFKRG